MWGGMAQVVFHVEDGLARIAKTADYATTVMPASINDFLLIDKPPLTEPQLAQRLKDLLAFPAADASRLTGPLTAEERQTMSKKNKSKKTKVKPKADKVKKTRATKPTASANGRVTGKVFGYSIGAVLRRMGKEGISKQDAAKILAAKGIKSSQITISVNIDSGTGGFNRGEPAPLTAEQVKELKALA